MTASGWQWPLLARLAQVERCAAERLVARGPLSAGIYEFLRFGLKQAWACLFGGTMLFLILATRYFYPHHALLARDDFLFLAALMLQAGMLWTGPETFAEAEVICTFHVVGTIMEVYKTATGSWLYPGSGLFHIGGVPLFTGFMYAAVGSYIARIWRLMDLRFADHPSRLSIALLSIAIYTNFFADSRGIDLRWFLLAVTAWLFGRTTVFFRNWRQFRNMPLLLGFFLIAVFIWFAENIGTFTGTWLYPSQRVHWHSVPLSKLTSWLLLMIVSYSLVALVNGISSRSTSQVEEPISC